MDIASHPELIHPTAYVAPNATIVGEVHVAAEASVWFGCVLRGDNAPIVVGARTNVQDLVVIHVDERQPCTLGEGITVGHRAVLHSATIEDGALVGIGAIVLNGAVVGREALVGAGALLPAGMVVPPRHLALGVPARVVRELTVEEIERLHDNAVHYVAQARAYVAQARTFLATGIGKGE
ncbi:MAG: gamma carbonic anhydrase family protein [Chloroflexota bacterium]|nr:gamma carbonic anhydrase family protein [Chloroflexota bacterium]